MLVSSRTQTHANHFIQFIYLLLFYSEVEQSLAISISDRATDEVIEALTRCRRGLDISDSQTVQFENAETPDIVRSRSSQDSMGFVQIRDLDLSHRNLDSPTVSDLCCAAPNARDHSNLLVSNWLIQLIRLV